MAIIKLHEQRAVSRCAFWCPRALYCQLTSFFWLEDQVWQHSLLLCIIKRGALSCCPSPKSAELRLSPSVQSDSKTSCLIPGEWCGYENCIVNGCFISLKYFTWTSLRISGNKFGNLSISYGKALSQSFFFFMEGGSKELFHWTSIHLLLDTENVKHKRELKSLQKIFIARSVSPWLSVKIKRYLENGLTGSATRAGERFFLCHDTSILHHEKAWA